MYYTIENHSILCDILFQLAKSFLSIVGSLLDVDPEEIRKSQAESQAATRSVFFTTSVKHQVHSCVTVS